MTHLEIVKKLIGPLKPIGDTTEDNKRFKNLQDTCDLIESLLWEVKLVSNQRLAEDYSIKRAGEFAHKFIETL